LYCNQFADAALAELHSAGHEVTLITLQWKRRGLERNGVV
jgi:hypothetical protein